MKKAFCLFIIIISCVAYAGSEFQWYRVRFLLSESEVYKKWDAGLDYDLEFLDYLEKVTTLKINKKANETTFEDIEKISQYPLVFMTAAGDIKFKDIEIKNMREYCNRGGFIFADDCCWTPMGGDAFFRSFKRLVEEKIFPGKKMFLLPLDHPVYHCHFDLNRGLPYMQGVAHGGYGLADDKGRLLVFLSPHDIHCGWSSVIHRTFPDRWTAAKREQAFEMATNIVVYALTH